MPRAGDRDSIPKWKYLELGNSFPAHIEHVVLWAGQTEWERLNGHSGLTGKGPPGPVLAATALDHSREKKIALPLFLNILQKETNPLSPNSSTCPYGYIFTTLHFQGLFNPSCWRWMLFCPVFHIPQAPFVDQTGIQLIVSIFSQRNKPAGSTFSARACWNLPDTLCSHMGPRAQASPCWPPSFSLGHKCESHRGKGQGPPEKVSYSSSFVSSLEDWLQSHYEKNTQLLQKCDRQ